MQEKKQPKVQVRNLTKKFGDLLVLDNISFDVQAGEFLCIVGPSGAGKTTFLNSLTKLSEPEVRHMERGMPLESIKSPISTRGLG